VQTEGDAAGQMLAGNTPVTCRSFRGSAAKADTVATAAGRGTRHLNIKKTHSTRAGMSALLKLLDVDVRGARG
jgi:hypothetical protein